VVLQETALLEARTAIAEARGTDVRPGDPAWIRVGGAAPIEAAVTAVGDTLDPTTRTYLVRALVPNEDHRLKAGLFAEIEIRPRSKQDVLLVPRDALRSFDGEECVLAVRDGRAVPVRVEVGAVSEESAEVRGELVPGELVLVGEAVRGVEPGTRVRVEQASAEPRTGAAS
jgi:multidrug efflux pump subunit AcrA (membrane-fusion protein)